MPDEKFHYEGPGICPVCEQTVVFRSKYHWYRAHLRCPSCDSVVRERAVALAVQELVPNWREADIHESSPSDRGVSRKLRTGGDRYIASHYFPGQPSGEQVNRFRNENLEKQTFADESFDLVVSLDVMEHVFNPDLVYQEVYRTLRPGGYYIHTFPIEKTETKACQPRATISPEGKVQHLVPEPEYHGNPINPDGSLVTMRYGYDIHRQIAEWAPFEVRVYRCWDRTHGIMGDYNEVVLCRKPCPAV